MIKLQTGISTDMDFIKAMKEKGQEVSAEFPAETLRKQFDEISEEDITMNMTNETFLEEVANGEEVEPTPTEVTVIIDVDGLEEGDTATGTIGNEAITEFPAEITREKGTKEELTVEAEGYVSKTETVTFNKDKEVIVTLEKEVEPEPSIKLVEARKINVSGATEQDNQGIVENEDKYEVSKEDNNITVSDNGLIPYIGGNIEEPRKWFGLLVDFGVKVQGTEYNIEDVDYEDAARWGAENDTTFVMWLNTENIGDFTFTSVENEEDTVTISVTLSR